MKKAKIEDLEVQGNFNHFKCTCPYCNYTFNVMISSNEKSYIASCLLCYNNYLIDKGGNYG